MPCVSAESLPDLSFGCSTSAMEDPPLHKIAISGPTLASMIQSFSASPSAVDGILFGHVTHLTPTLSDDSVDLVSSSTLIATITGFFCSGTINSFYNSTGAIEPTSLRRFFTDPLLSRQYSLLGWFSGRRKTQPRPSMREFSVTASLSSMAEYSLRIENSPEPVNFKPCLFLLFASPLSDQSIHTHEYRAYQFSSSTELFEPKAIDIVNIGPAFRGHYDSFSPSSPFPSLACELRSSPMNVDKDGESMKRMKQVSKDQKELDMCAEGFEVGNWNRMIGSEATHYTAGLEDLYEKMLVKVETLARLVESSSAKVVEQENLNRKLRYKISRSTVSE